MSCEPYATSFYSACNISSIEVEKDVDILEEVFVSVNKEVDTGIKEEKIAEDVTFHGIKSEPDEVNYLVYVYY